MTLIFDNAVPEGVITTAQETLERLACVPDARGGSSPLRLAFVSEVPLAVYSLGLESLARDGELDRAKAVAWRVFVVNDRDEPVGSAEVAPPSGAGPAYFLGLTRGPQVAASGKALSEADTDPPDQARYEPRFLEIPGINTAALWLKSLDGGEDRIVPIEPVPRFLRDQSRYTPGEFLERVRPKARNRLEHNDIPSVTNH